VRAEKLHRASPRWTRYTQLTLSHAGKSSARTRSGRLRGQIRNSRLPCSHPWSVPARRGEPSTPVFAGRCVKSRDPAVQCKRHPFGLTSAVCRLADGSTCSPGDYVCVVRIGNVEPAQVDKGRDRQAVERAGSPPENGRQLGNVRGRTGPTLRSCDVGQRRKLQHASASSMVSDERARLPGTDFALRCTRLHEA